MRSSPAFFFKRSARSLANWPPRSRNFASSVSACLRRRSISPARYALFSAYSVILSSDFFFSALFASSSSIILPASSLVLRSMCMPMSSCSWSTMSSPSRASKDDLMWASSPPDFAILWISSPLKKKRRVTFLGNRRSTNACHMDCSVWSSGT